MKTIAIRVSDDEHKLFADLAAREFMPLSVLVRRTLHAEAVRVGLVLDPVAESKRALKADSPQIAELASTITAYGINEDGTINHRLRVAKARTLANEGMTKAQVIKAMGLTLEQLEISCTETAKQGRSGVLPWHSETRAYELGRLTSDPSYRPQEGSNPEALA